MGTMSASAAADAGVVSGLGALRTARTWVGTGPSRRTGMSNVAGTGEPPGRQAFTTLKW